MSDRSKDDYSAFTVFAFVFALAQLFEHSYGVATFFDYSSKVQNISKLLSVLLCFSAVWVMLKPSSLYRSILLYVVIVIRTIDALPRSPNHVVFQAIVLISILTCFIYLKVKDKNNFSKTNFYENFKVVDVVQKFCL